MRFQKRKNVFLDFDCVLTPVFSSSQHTGISEVTYPHIRYISSRMTGFGRTYEVRTASPSRKS